MQTEKSAKRHAKHHAACVACRRRKIKCVRTIPGDVCVRCKEWSEECTTVPRRFGRLPGSKNKKTLMKLKHESGSVSPGKLNGPDLLTAAAEMIDNSGQRKIFRAPSESCTSANDTPGTLFVPPISLQRGTATPETTAPHLPKIMARDFGGKFPQVLDGQMDLLGDVGMSGASGGDYSDPQRRSFQSDMSRDVAPFSDAHSVGQGNDHTGSHNNGHGSHSTNGHGSHSGNGPSSHSSNGHGSHSSNGHGSHSSNGHGSHSSNGHGSHSTGLNNTHNNSSLPVGMRTNGNSSLLRKPRNTPSSRPGSPRGHLTSLSASMGAPPPPTTQLSSLSGSLNASGPLSGPHAAPHSASNSHTTPRGASGPLAVATPQDSPSTASTVSTTTTATTSGLDNPSNPLEWVASLSAQTQSAFDVLGERITALFDVAEMANTFRAPALCLDRNVGPAMVLEGFKTLIGPMRALPTAPVLVRIDAQRLDICPSRYDPIECDILSPAEADRFYTYFFTHVQPTLRLLDGELYTMEHVRARSSFLFAVILEAAAALGPDAVVYRRLQRHVNFLWAEVHSHGFKSLYICQAAQIRSSWVSLPDSKQVETWQYMSAAITMAIELRLDALLPHSVASDPEYAAADGPRRARLVRNAQRTWICLYNRERTFSTMVGRRPIMPEGPLTETSFLEAWCTHPCEVRNGDAALICAATLRKQMPTVMAETLAEFTNQGASFSALAALVDARLARWHAQWPQQSVSHFKFSLVATCARFLILSSPYEKCLRAQTMDAADRDQCLVCALEICLDAIREFHEWTARRKAHGEKYFVPTMTYAMVTYAALFAVKLLELKDNRAEGDMDVDLYHLALVAQLGLQLIEQGQIYEHETSPAAIFGEQLLDATRYATRVKVAATLAAGPPAAVTGESEDPAITGMDTLSSLFFNDPVLASGLSLNSPLPPSAPLPGEGTSDDLIADLLWPWSYELAA